MPSASLNISVIEKRLLTWNEGADYCGCPRKIFKAICPVIPIEIRPGEERLDKRDLDSWIDAMKDEAGTAGLDEMLGRI